MCLDDAIPPSDRRNLTNAEGESYAVGMWVSNWASSRLSSAIAQILIEEKVGFHVRTSEGSLTAAQMFAITGCATPADSEDRGCGPDGPKQTYFHVGMEGWTSSNLKTWAQIQRDFPATAPVNLGTIGYEGESGHYISSEVVENAWAATGLALEFYRSYDASWYTPGLYFDRITAANSSDLVPCNGSRLAHSEPMQNYVEVTGDQDGVEYVDGKIRGKCFDDYFWLPPPCRVDLSKRFLFLTIAGYEIEVTMQRATIFNMPIVPADVKDWDAFARLPTQINCLFYWWEPDPTFLGLGAKMVSYPRYNASAWQQGLQISSNQASRLENYGSHDLQVLAPTVRELVSAFSLSPDVLTQLLMAQKSHGATAMDAACSWLLRSRNIWEEWIPDTTACFPQFGLFNEVTDTTVFQKHHSLSFCAETIVQAARQGHAQVDELEPHVQNVQRVPSQMARGFALHASMAIILFG